MSRTDAPTRIQVSHASGLHAVERQLAGMHQEMLRQGKEDARSVCLSVLNLVVICTDADSERIAGETVALVAANHPSRALIIVADRQGPAQIEADVSLECALDGDGRICAEVAWLRVTGEPALHLISVVTPLLVPDVPVFLWLAGSPPLEQAFGEEAINICERLLIDTGAYGDAAATLAELCAHMDRASRAVNLADLAWARTHRWRELVAKAFDGVEMRPLVRHVDSVEIACAGDEVSAQGWLLGGWLASRLDFPAGHGAPVRARADADTAVPRGDLVSVRIHCQRVDVSATVTVERKQQAGHVTIDLDGGSSATSTVPLTDVDTSQLVGALIEDDSDDPIYTAALHAGAELAARI